jgi:hypothetical protein
MLSALSLLVGCGGSGSSGQDGDGGVADEYEAVLFDNTRLLDEASLDDLSEVSATGELRFDGVPTDLEGIEPGAVIVAPRHRNARSGLLRFVLEVDEDDDDLVLQTAHVPIEFAFRELHVTLTRTVSDLGAVEGAEEAGLREQFVFSGAHFSALDFDDYPINGDEDEDTTEDQAHAYGFVGGGFEYRFELNLDWGEVDEIPSKVLDCLAEQIVGMNCLAETFLPEVIVNFDV